MILACIAMGLCIFWCDIESLACDPFGSVQLWSAYSYRKKSNDGMAKFWTFYRPRDSERKTETKQGQEEYQWKLFMHPARPQLLFIKKILEHRNFYHCPDLPSIQKWQLLKFCWKYCYWMCNKLTCIMAYCVFLWSSLFINLYNLHCEKILR